MLSLQGYTVDREYYNFHLHNFRGVKEGIEYERALCVHGYQDVWEAAVSEVLGQVRCVAVKPKDATIIGHLPQMASWFTLLERLPVKALRTIVSLSDPKDHLSVSGVL